MKPLAFFDNVQASAFAGRLCLIAILAPISANAADIPWQATPSQTAAWLAPTGWTGGAMPLAGDVAIFNNVGAATIGYSMYHALNPTPGSANIGALWLTASRTTNDLAIETTSPSANVFFYHGATISGQENVVLRNDSNRNLVLRPANAAAASSIRLTDGRESRVVLTGAGNVAIRSAITGNGASLIVNASGSGALELGGAGGTYSGGTILEQGRLLITADNASGTGTIMNQGGTVEVSEGVIISNPVEHQNANALFRRHLKSGSLFAGASLRATGGFEPTTVRFLAGSATASGTLEAHFSSSSLALNDGDRVSAILNLDLPTRDIYVLSMTGDTGNGMIGWQDEGEWKNAVAGNLTLGSQAISGYQGSFATSGVLATADYLGSWGYDAATQTGWAVVDHGGAFSVVAIPEPACVALAAFGGILFLGRYWKATVSL